MYWKVLTNVHLYRFRAEPRVIPGLMGEREGFGPKVLVTCLPPLLGISPILFSLVAEGLWVFLTPGFRFGRLFPGMNLLRQLLYFFPIGGQRTY